MAFKVAGPSIPGIITSRTINWGRHSSICSSACCPDSHAVSSNPPIASRASSATVRISGSSSTIRIRFRFSGGIAAILLVLNPQPSQQSNALGIVCLAGRQQSRCSHHQLRLADIAPANEIDSANQLPEVEWQPPLDFDSIAQLLCPICNGRVNLLSLWLLTALVALVLQNLQSRQLPCSTQQAGGVIRCRRIAYSPGQSTGYLRNPQGLLLFLLRPFSQTLTRKLTCNIKR